MNKNISIGVLLGIIVILGFTAFKTPAVISVPTDIKVDASALGSAKAPVVNVPAPIVNVAAPRVTVEAPKSSPVLAGALADIPSPYFTFGRVTKWARRIDLAQGTSTICAIQAPIATSTLDLGSGVSITLASTSAVTIDFARGTNQYATSTKIGNTIAIGASAYAHLTASTTASSGAPTMFAPNEWFIVRINEYSSSSGARNAPVGTCQAKFTQLAY